MRRLVLQRVRMRLALRDVAHRRDEEAARPDLRRVDQELERKQARVLALAHGLESAGCWQVLSEPALDVVHERSAVRRRDERVDLLSDKLLLVVAEQPAHRGVDRVDHARRVQGDEPVGHVVEH